MSSSSVVVEENGETRMTVDMRSDTVTKPSKAMREAMSLAEVGDDVFRDDPTVLKLEEKMAQMTGKEAALFVPSGTMGNLICVLAHCWGRGAEVLLGDRSHIHIYEQGGVAQLGGVHPRTLKTLDNGTFSLEELESKVRGSDQHYPVTQLVAIENTQNKCGGAVLPAEWLEKLGAVCKRMGLPLHCDGARLFNAAVSQGKTVKELLTYADSASICLSKGLGCPVGSVIVGTKDLIMKGIRLRKVLGGAMRQAGVLAAAGLYALEHQVDRLADDHRHAATMASAVNKAGGGRCVARKVQTNLVIVWVDPSLATPDQVVDMLAAEKVLAVEMGQELVRLAFHCDVSSEMADIATKTLVGVISRLLE